MNQPLNGLKVVEFAGLGPAPFAAMLLAQAGATVIRIDRPGSPPAEGILAGGRPTVSLDLKTEGGRAEAHELIAQADVLLEGFRPGVMERLGLGPDTCLETNPRLIYGRVTGWGQDGPRANEAGHDINYLALTGALRSIARNGQPPVPPLNLVGDYGGGGLLLAFGVLLALQERTNSGSGQVVDAAMVDGISLLMAGIWNRRAQGDWSAEPGTNDIDSGAPFYDAYRTSDNEYMAVGSYEPQFYTRLLHVLELDPVTLGEQWDRSSWPQTKQVIADRFAAGSRHEWAQRFAGVDACVTPVLSMGEAASDPQIMARATIAPGAHGPQPGPAPRLSRTPLDAAATTQSHLIGVVEALQLWGAAGRLNPQVAAIAS
jgi:alpha-methylacyl-CoA racemase